MPDEQNAVPDKTPAVVADYAQAGSREPASDPTLGIAVGTKPKGVPQHRLVCIGDSLTHGFQSGAVNRTDLSYPAILAYELGWLGGFRFPRYPSPVGGIPMNVEWLLRALESRFGPEVSWWETPFAIAALRDLMDGVEDYWERGNGSTHVPIGQINHCLAVYGWTLTDALTKTASSLRAEILAPSDDLLSQVVENNAARAGLRVYPDWDDSVRDMTLFDAARTLGAERERGTDAGIETLVVFLGANNVLPAVTKLDVRWSDTDQDPTVWHPQRFAAEYDRIVAEVSRIDARHVILCTVPHVTVAPVARGVGGKLAPGSRYFQHYARPWVADGQFQVGRDRSITGQQAWVLDAAVDMYNDHIQAAVETARRKKKDWYLLDIAGLLDRLAQRRYIEDPSARPPWWEPYPLPAALVDLDPDPDSRFLGSDPNGRRDRGGLFSLDGVHPTTIGYGLVAQELAGVMVRAGVEFRTPAGAPRPGPVEVDFRRLIDQDTLLIPPTNIASVLDVLGKADETLNLFGQSLPF